MYSDTCQNDFKSHMFVYGDCVCTEGYISLPCIDGFIAGHITQKEIHYMHKKHSWKYLFISQEYHNETRVSEDMDLENKAIMDRRYYHIHKFGRWIHSKRKERGITMCVCVCCVCLIGCLWEKKRVHKWVKYKHSFTLDSLARPLSVYLAMWKRQRRCYCFVSGKNNVRSRHMMPTAGCHAAVSYYWACA